MIDIKDVVGFMSQDHYTCIYTKESEFISDLSLSHLEKRLNPEDFLRCHRNNIIRIEQIKSIGVGANMTVQMSNNLELPVSRTNRDQLRKRVLTK